MMQTRTITSRILGVVGFGCLILWTLATVAPALGSILGSLKSQTEIIAEPLSLPERLMFDNYRRAWGGTNLGKPWIVFARNSVIATSTGVLVGIGAGTLAGYAVARSKTWLGGIVDRYFVLLITLPFIVTWVPLFVLSDRLGVLSNPAAIGVMYAARLIPFAAVMMRAYFTSFPLDLIEAAYVDGAAELSTFRRVVLPLSWGAVIAVGLINFIFLWNELGLAQVLLLDPGSRTLPVGLTQFRGQFRTDFGAMYAALIITIAPIVVLYSLAQKKLTEGLRLGAIK